MEIYYTTLVIIKCIKEVFTLLNPDYRDFSPDTENGDLPCREDNCYVVKAGDTIYEISKFYNIPLDDLIEANPDIEPDLILPGQALCIPQASSLVNCPIGASIYTVQKGDTFYSIAKRCKMRLSALLNANPNINPDALLIGQSICIPMISSSFTSETYKVKVKYPYLWSKIDNNRYAGIDGFLQVFAISSDAELMDVCGNEAYHKLKPYGTSPTIAQATIDGHKACFIIPSSDQPMEMRSQSALIVKYDRPIEHEGTNLKYLIVQTDKDHLKDIADTLELLDKN